MTHPTYIRDKARQLRMERDLTIDEIAERLAVSRTTVFHWVRDLPLKESPARTVAQLRAAAAVKEKYKALRDEAYEAGFSEYDELIQEPTFRDFVCMYIGEGYKRSPNRVALGNSNSNVLILAEHWIRRCARRPVKYSLQYHADQDPAELGRRWGQLLRIEPAEIRMQRKSNSNQLTGRQWRSRLGVLTVSSDDTYLRARIQAWMDRVFEEWLDSAG